MRSEAVMKRGCLVGEMVLLGLAGVWIVREVGEAREAARRSQCVGHLKWITVAFYNYHDVYGTFPPGTIPNPGLPPERRLGWVVEVVAVHRCSSCASQVRYALPRPNQ